MLHGEQNLPEVVSVRPMPEYMLDLVFSNGERKRYDASGLLRFAAFRDLPRVFHAARVEYGNVVWPGDLDGSPDTLYLRSTAV